MFKDRIQKSIKVFENIVSKVNEDSISQEIADITDILKSGDFSSDAEEVRLHKRLRDLKNKAKSSGRPQERGFEEAVQEDNDVTGKDGNAPTGGQAGMATMPLMNSDEEPVEEAFVRDQVLKDLYYNFSGIVNTSITRIENRLHDSNDDTLKNIIKADLNRMISRLTDLTKGL